MGLRFYSAQYLYSSLRPLETLAAFGQSVLHAFFLAGITGQKTCVFEPLVKIRLEFGKCSGYAEAYGAGLSQNSSAIDLNCQIKFGEIIRNLERTKSQIYKIVTLQIIIQLLAVYDEFSGTGQKPNLATALFRVPTA